MEGKSDNIIMPIITWSGIIFLITAIFAGITGAETLGIVSILLLIFDFLWLVGIVVIDKLNPKDTPNGKGILAFILALLIEGSFLLLGWINS